MNRHNPNDSKVEVGITQDKRGVALGTSVDKRITLELTGNFVADDEFIATVSGAFKQLASAKLGNDYNTTYEDAPMNVNARNCRCTARGTFNRNAVFAFAPKLRAAVDALADRRRGEGISLG